MKKFLIILVCVLIVGLIAVGAFLGWRNYQNAAYFSVNGVRYLRTETQLDLSDEKNPDLLAISQMENLQRLDLRGTEISAEDYQLLRAALPECNILWDIPFQGSFYDESTSHLTVTELTEADIDALAYFHNLREVDARSCTDYQTIFDARDRYPDCRISYQVTVSGQAYTDSTISLTVADADTHELELALEWLPRLTAIHLSGQLPEPEWLAETTQKYPEIDLSWEYRLFDRVFGKDITEIDLSGVKMDSTEAVEAALPYFPELTKVVMCNCGIPSEEMDALDKRHDDIRFVWSVLVGKAELRTDLTVFMPFQYGYSSGFKLNDKDCAELKYCTDLICLDMGHMQVSDISFLNYMPNMQYLLLGDTLVTDLTPIGSLKELVYLEIFLIDATDFSPLAGCTKLEDLNMSWTKPSNIEVLKDLPNLKNLWLVGTVYPYWAFLELKQALPDAHFAIAWQGSSTGLGWRRLPNYYAQRDLLGMGYMSG